MLGLQPISEFVCLEEAVRLLLSPRLSSAFLLGMTGGVARSRSVVPNWLDLTTWTLPGLEALGVATELLTFPEDGVELARLFSQRLRYRVTVPVLAFTAPVDTEAETLLWEREEAGSDGLPLEAEAEVPAVAHQGLVTQQETTKGLTFTWRDANQETHSSSQEEFRSLFSHALPLRHGSTPDRRPARIQTALLRWVAYAAAFPERFPTAKPLDSPVRASAAAFLQEVVGKQQNPVATRLRRAANAFATVQSQADLETALYHLREAILLDIRLPAIVQQALLVSPDLALTDLERHELIYFARAGTPLVKVLAARRLLPELSFSDVRSTLLQLCYEPHPWVRAVVQNIFPPLSKKP